jgi:hypothetical protein
VPTVPDAVRLAKCAAAARIAAGVAFAAAPRRLGGVLVGQDAGSAGARLFIAAFGARDVLLGAGTLQALHAGRPARWSMASCAAADAFDTAATIRGFAGLPPRRRGLTLIISAAPAALGSWLSVRLPSGE